MLQAYIRNLIKVGEWKIGRIEALLMVARIFHPTSNRPILARRIRALFLYYRVYEALPAETRGGKRSGSSILDNELVFLAYRAWLLSQAIGIITAQSFQIMVNKELLPRLLITTTKEVSLRIVYRWLARLGFTNSKE
jgi:hypothetical protein